MHKLSKSAFINVWQFISDFVFLLFSFIAAYQTSSMITVLNPIYDYLWVLFIYMPFWCFYMATMGCITDYFQLL